MISQILLYLNTLKYLKVKQILWRFFNYLPKRFIFVSYYPGIKYIFLKTHFLERNKSTNDFNSFCFLNETYTLSEIGWDNLTISKLWRYNLHYFDFLNQTDSNSKLNFKCKIIDNWIKSNPIGQGTGWEPYPTSLRIVNWIKWDIQTHNLSHDAKLSLWNQVRWLSNRIEFHILGNHLFTNAKALLFALVYFDISNNSIIYKKTFKLLQSELDEQFLNDGAHFELSPMYHALAMEDLLDIINISNNFKKQNFIENVNQKVFDGLYWLSSMKYDNDELSNFNDSANSIAPKYSNLIGYAKRLLIKIKPLSNLCNIYFADSGFVVIKDAKCHLIADIGKIGPDYLPGHAHADTLSFELSIHGQRVILNSGTSIYGNSDLRKWQRSTSAHSTIELDGKNSSEVWSGFRVAKRARPFDFNFKYRSKSQVLEQFSASHDGYLRLKHRPIHTRMFVRKDFGWIIRDIVTGFNNIVKSRFYFHSSLRLNPSDNGISIEMQSRSIALIKFKKELSFEIDESYHYVEFGKKIKNSVLILFDKSPTSIDLEIHIL